MRSRALVLTALLLATGCSLVNIELTPRIKPLEERTVEGSGRTKILLTDISGFLSEEGSSPALVIGAPPPRVPLLVRLREELKKAEDDQSVKALIIRINSTGGTVTASDIMFKEIDLFKKKAKIPVFAVMMDVAASGGYYVALAADTIVAHPTSVTGSIGVIMLSLNAEGLLQKIGDDSFYPTVGTAVDAYVAASGIDWIDWEERGDEGSGASSGTSSST